MKKLISALVAGIVGISSVQAVAEDVEFGIDTLVGFQSAYVYRGTNLYDGVSIQPQITGSADFGDSGTFIADVWDHSSASNSDNSKRFNEVDYTLGYSVPVDIVTLGAGYKWYRYQNNNIDFPASQEFYVSAALDTVANPTLVYYRDVDAYEMNYYELTFSEEFDEVCGMGDGFNVEPYVTFGFVSDAEGIYEKGGLIQTTVGVSSTLALGDISVVPSLNYSFESDAATDNQFWAGFVLGYSWL